MSRSRSLIVKLFLVLILVGPLSARAQSSDPEYRALLFDLIATLQQQIELLQAELAAQTVPIPSVTVTVAGKEGVMSSSVDMIATYAVESVADIGDIPDRSHRQYFTRVYELFPSEYEAKFGRVAVFADTDIFFDAFVETLPPLHDRWLYAVHEDMLNEPQSEWNTELIVHELAHVVSYETVSGELASGTRTCDAYFDMHGCPPTQSYLWHFVEAFWSESDLDRALRYAQRDDSYESAYDYYDLHSSRFVSDYAAVGPEEDFAESFMFFMLERTPPHGEANEKVAFFTEFEDMVSMRAEIKKEK